MAKAFCCDNCGNLIADKDVRIVLSGYEVMQNRKNEKMPKGYGIGKPDEFCSFACLSEWALKEQKLLDDYLALATQTEEAHP